MTGAAGAADRDPPDPRPELVGIAQMLKVASGLDQCFLCDVLGVCTGAEGTGQSDEVGEQRAIARVEPLQLGHRPRPDGFHTLVV